MKKNSRKPGLMTTNEAAAYFGVNRLTFLNHFVKTGIIPYYPVGTEYRFLLEDLDEYFITIKKEFNRVKGIYQ